MPVVRITDDSWERLKKFATPLEDSTEDAVRKVLDAAEEHLKCPGQSTPKTDTKTKAARRHQSGRLQRGVKVSQGEYRRPILEAINKQGGRAPVDMVLQYIEERMKHYFTEVDYELIPSGGSIRWQNTAEWEFYLKKFYENRAAYGYLLQMDVLLHFHRVTRELHKLEESGKPITVFVERSPYDIIHVFLESNKDFYNDDMYRSLIRMTEEYCNLKVWKDASYVILNSPSELCISRIRERDRDGECNIDREYVIMICNAYKDMAKMFGAGIQHLDNTGKITDTALALLDMYKI